MRSAGDEVVEQRLSLHGPTVEVVRAQIEKEFTQFAAAGFTFSHRATDDPADDKKAWRERRTAATKTAVGYK